MCDVVLRIGRKVARGFNCLIEKFCHRSFPLLVCILSRGLLESYAASRGSSLVNRASSASLCDAG
jgi:hypothetical protein